MGTFLTDVVLALLSFVAENERANIGNRQAEGIAAAKAKGVRFGAPQKNVPESFAQARQLWSLYFSHDQTNLNGQLDHPCRSK